MYCQHTNLWGMQMDAGFVEEVIVRLNLLQQVLGVGVGDLAALLHHFGHVAGHTESGWGPLLLVLGGGQFDTLQVQGGATYTKKVSILNILNFTDIILID